MKKLSVLLLTAIACCMLWACGKTATFNESEEETTTHNLSLVTLVSLPTFTEGITFAFKCFLITFFCFSLSRFCGMMNIAICANLLSLR